MREYYIIQIVDYYNHITVTVEQEFDTYEEVVNYIIEQYDDLEQLNDWSWTDGHDLYQIMPCIDY